MADRDEDETTGGETETEGAGEPKAKKFKYTPKAKPQPAAEPAVAKTSKKAPPPPDDDDEDEDDEAPPSASDPEDGDDDSEDEGSDEESGAPRDENAGEDEEEEAPEPAKENRAARRKKKKVKEGATSKDRNERVRKQLLKKKIEAEAEPETLTAGEMVDDAFARGVASAGKWLKRNSVVVQYVLLAGLLGTVGFGIYSWRTSTKSEEASGLLSRAVAADRGRVDADPPPKQPGEEELFPTYKTSGERVDAALGSYKRAAAASNGTGAAILARLGEAGVLLDAKKWDEALAAYREVKASPLANADVDVKARSLEGIGFALEGKGDPNAAMGVFKELEAQNARGFKELGMYHQARLHAAKGEKDKALELIKAARERLKADPRGFAYLDGVLDELGRAVDPSLGVQSGKGKSGKSMGLEQLMNIEDMIKKTQGGE